MKRNLALVLTMAGVCAQAQIHVDKPVVLNAADPSLRTVQGLAPAESTTGLINTTDAQNGRYHWAQVSGTAMAIQLSLNPAADAYSNGMEIRFLPLAVGMGAVTVNVNGLGAKRLYRSDGLPVSAGLLAPGNIASIVYADTAFFMAQAPKHGCPDGFLPVNGQYCIQRNDTVNVSIFTAARWCYDRGARLCSWGEYIHACTVQQASMEGMYNDWEWIDDSSDHSHTADQAGRYQCRSIRNVGALEDSNNFGRVRCCYTVR